MFCAAQRVPFEEHLLARGWLVREVRGYLVRISVPREVRLRRYTAWPCSISISRSVPKRSALRQRRLVAAAAAAAAGTRGSGAGVLSCGEACGGPGGGRHDVMRQIPAASVATWRETAVGDVAGADLAAGAKCHSSTAMSIVRIDKRCGKPLRAPAASVLSRRRAHVVSIQSPPMHARHIRPTAAATRCLPDRAAFVRARLPARPPAATPVRRAS